MSALVYRSTIVLVLVLVSLGLTATRAGAITIEFDYTKDSGNFFSNATAKSALEAAGGFFESRLTDDLNAISPSGGNEWTATFTHPGDGSNAQIENMSVAADTLMIFAGGRDLGGGTLGVGGHGGWSGSGTSNWLDTLQSRGEGDTDNGDGDPATEYGPWGGAISFDTLDDGVTRNWHFDHTSDPGSGSHDFYSVALHEIGHVLGIGTADSWDSLVNEDGEFIGANATDEHGGNVPLNSTESHWSEDITSGIFPDGASQEAAMDPSIASATRKHFTDLDMAGLEDIGWSVVPEPSSVALLAAMGGLLLWRRPRRDASA